MVDIRFVVLASMLLVQHSNSQTLSCALLNGLPGKCVHSKVCANGIANNPVDNDFDIIQTSPSQLSKHNNVQAKEATEVETGIAWIGKSPKCPEHYNCCPVMLSRIVTPEIGVGVPVYAPPPAGPPLVTPFPTVPPVATFPSAFPIFPTQSVTALPPWTYPPATAPATLPGFPTALPIVQAPTVGTGSRNNMAAQKCQEYKHRLIKRESASPSISTYIFGGTESSGKEFPHMAALGYMVDNNNNYNNNYGVEYLCGGSLISEQFVLTAAHCLMSLDNLVTVRLGDINLKSTTDDAAPQDYNIIQRFVNPNYVLPSQYNDLALLKLDRQVQFNDYISPICLEIDYNLPPNVDLVATGWGKTEPDGGQSDNLMKVHLQYFDNAQCRAAYQGTYGPSLPLGIEDATQLCAGSRVDDKDTCQGDSGGPLQVFNDNIWYAVGITSFGKYACGIPNVPGVYTRVSYYVPWIENIVWPTF